MMKKLVKNIGGLGVLCVALGAGTSVNAQGTISADKIVTAPTAYPGKIVVVDKTANSFTVEIQGQLYLFKATPNTKLLRKGKLVEFKDLAPGQQVTLVIQQVAGGEIQVVSLAVEGSETEAQPAGDASGSGKDLKKPVPGVGNGLQLNSTPAPTVSPFN